MTLNKHKVFFTSSLSVLILAFLMMVFKNQLAEAPIYYYIFFALAAAVTIVDGYLLFTSIDVLSKMISRTLSFVRIFVCFLLIVLFFLTVRTVKGHSMSPTYEADDYVVMFHFFNYIKEEDIVIFKDQDTGQEHIKRIVADAFDTISIGEIDGIRYLKINDVFYQSPTGKYYHVDENCFTGKISKNRYFVLGDNANDSRDSRHPNVGLIHERSIIGKVVSFS